MYMWPSLGVIFLLQARMCIKTVNSKTITPEAGILCLVVSDIPQTVKHHLKP